MDNSWSWDDETWAEYFRVMDQQQGRDAATHRPAGNRPPTLSETFTARLAPVAKGVQRFAETPAGGFMFDRLNAFDQRLNYLPGLVGSGLRGDTEAFERIARGTPSVLANTGGGYEPGDITGNALADMGITALVDPTTYIPGGGAPRAAARAGLSDAVKAPGIRAAAVRSAAPEPQRVQPYTPTGRPQAKEIARMERLDAEMRPRLETPEAQARLRELIDEGMAQGAHRWYQPEEVANFITRALGEGQEAEEFFNILALVTAATSPLTDVPANIDKALTVMQRIYGGQTFDDIVATIAANPGLRSELTGTVLNQATFPKGTVRKALELGTIDGQKVTTFWANFFKNIDSVTIDTHNARQFFYVAGLDFRVPQDRAAIADILSMNTRSKGPDYWASLTPGDFASEMYSVISDSPVYSTIENMQRELAAQVGLTPRDFQSALWVGASDITKVKDTTNFAQLFLRRVEAHAQRLGVEPEEIIRRVHRGDMRISEVLGQDEVATIMQRIGNRALRASDEREPGEFDEVIGADLYGLGDFDSLRGQSVGFRDALGQATAADLPGMMGALNEIGPEDEERSLQEYLRGMHEGTFSGQPVGPEAGQPFWEESGYESLGEWMGSDEVRSWTYPIEGLYRAPGALVEGRSPFLSSEEIMRGEWGMNDPRPMFGEAAVERFDLPEWAAPFLDMVVPDPTGAKKATDLVPLIALGAAGAATIAAGTKALTRAAKASLTPSRVPDMPPHMLERQRRTFDELAVQGERFAELPPNKASAEIFSDGMNSLKPGKREFVTTYTPDEILELFKEGHRAYITRDGAGFMISKGSREFKAVFNAGTERGVATSMVEEALRRDARVLWAFDATTGTNVNLPKLYGSVEVDGRAFREVDRMPWDDQYAPKNWDYDRYGRPDMVRMEVQRIDTP